MISSVTLPNQPSLHLFALTVAGAATPGGASAVNLQPYVNNAGTASDGTATAANFDGVGYGYSAQALQGAGVVRGFSVVAAGIAFQWPTAAPGMADNVTAQGQTVAFSAAQAGTFDGDMYRQTSPVSRTIYYVRDPGGRLLALTDGTTVYYYGLDGHGSVANLTDSSEAVVNTYRYDPYGNSLGVTETATLPNPWRYAGGYYEAESGLYLMGARYYAPTLGRFLQQDPLGSSGSQYAYAGSDPCNNSDPTGLTTCYHYVTPAEVAQRAFQDLVLGTNLSLAAAALGVDPATVPIALALLAEAALYLNAAAILGIAPGPGNDSGSGGGGGGGDDGGSGGGATGPSFSTTGFNVQYQQNFLWKDTCMIIRSRYRGGKMNCCLSWTSLLGALALLPLALVTSPRLHALPVLLRYRFAPGAAYVFRIAADEQHRDQQAGRAASITGGQVVYTMTYRVRGVDPTGVADAVVRLDYKTFRGMANGHAIVYRGNPPGLRLESRDHLGPDNSLPDLKDWNVTPHSFGHYGYQCIGPLSSSPVVPGQHWRTTASAYLGGFADYKTLLGGPDAPIHIDAFNVLQGYRRLAGHRIAVIGNTGTANNTQNVTAYAADNSGKRMQVRVHVTIQLTIESLFNVDQQRLQGSTEHFDARFSIVQPTATGARTFEQGQTMDDITVTAS